MLARFFVTSAAVFLALGSFARAQQAPNTLSPAVTPPGITVQASASVPVRAWLATVSFVPVSRAQQADGAEAARKRFEDAIVGLGVDRSTIVAVPDVGQSVAGIGQTTPFAALAQNSAPGLVSATVPFALLSKLRAIAKENLYKESGVQVTPVDVDALYAQAESYAIAAARAKAQAIAQADHQHVGRLINFTPSPYDLLKDSGGVFGVMFGGIGMPGVVTASGLATFEILP